MQRGARWDGTLDPKQPALGNCTGNFGNDIAAFTPDYIQFLRVFAETQMGVYENASGSPDSGSAGWFFCQFTGHAQTGRRWRITESAPRSELTD